MQAPPLKKGFMEKQSRQMSSFIKNWKRRYFVLDAGVLYYYENPLPMNTPPYGENLKGSMNLLNAHILEPKRDDEKTKKRIMVTAGVGEERDLLLEADSPKDAKDWIEALRKHCRYAAAKDKSPFPRLPSWEPTAVATTTGKLDPSAVKDKRAAESPVSASSSSGAASETRSQIIEPIPWFVIKVIRVDTRSKVFINICHHNDVYNLTSLRGTSKWPFVISNPGRKVSETKGESGEEATFMVYDVVVSSQLLALAAKDESVTGEICDKAIRHIRKTYKEDIEDEYKTPKIRKNYKGDMIPFHMEGTKQAKRSSGIFAAMNLAVTGGDTQRYSPAPQPVPSSTPANRESANLNGHNITTNSSLKSEERVTRTQSRVVFAPIPERTSPSLQNIAPFSGQKPSIDKPVKRIPYEVLRGAGTIAKKNPPSIDENAPGKVLPSGEKVFAVSRKVEKDGIPWLRTTAGWIPERLPGQGIGIAQTLDGKGKPVHRTSAIRTSYNSLNSIPVTDNTPLEQRVCVPVCNGPPKQINVITTRIVEIETGQGTFAAIGSWIGTYFGMSSNHHSGNMSNAAFRTIFVLEVSLPQESIIKTIKRLNFPSQLDGDRLLIYDVTSLLLFVDGVQKWLQEICSQLSADKWRNKELTTFIKPTLADVNLMELDLMAAGGLLGVADLAEDEEYSQD